MKAALPRSATGEEFQEGKFCGRASDVCFRGRGGMMKQGAGAADRLFTPVMIYCFLEGRKDPASGSARLRGRGRIAFFPRKHADEKNASHRSDNRADYRQGHGLFFQFTEVVGLLLRLLHQAVRLIDDIQPGGSHPHQECELFLRAICRHDKSVLSSSAVAGAIGVTWVRLKRMNPAAAARR